MAKSNIEKLLELKQLYEQGILTKEEMEAEKAKILGTSTPNPNPPITDSSPVITSEPFESINEEEETKGHFNKIKFGAAVVIAIIIVGLVGFYLLNQKESVTIPVEETELSQMPDNKIDKIPDRKTDGYNSILSERRLTEADLTGKSKKELELLRNSIFARYGYRFKRNDLFQHFSQYSWYAPTTSEESNVYGRMSEIEKFNIDFIKQNEDTVSPLSIKELLKIVSVLDIEEGFVTGVNNLSVILSIAKKHNYRIVDNAWMHSMGGYSILYKGCSLDHAGEFFFVKDIIEDCGSFVMIATKDWNAYYPIVTILLFRKTDLDYLISEAQSIGFNRVEDKDETYVYDKYELTIGQEGNDLCPNHFCYSISIRIEYTD